MSTYAYNLIMEFLKALLLGLVQGVCEFLPVSSSGHLILIEKILNTEGNILLLNILLHIATLFAIVLVFRAELLDLIKKPFSSHNKKILVSAIPTVVIVLVIEMLIKDAFTGKFLAVGFLVTAIMLLVDKLFAIKFEGNRQIGYGTAIIMGIFQGFAALPGISRSGSTVAAGSLTGADRQRVAKFSFFMSIPIIFASIVYEIIFKDGSFANFSAWFYITAFLAAFISGYFALKFMIRVVVKKRYEFFIIYLIAVSIVSFFI